MDQPSEDDEEETTLQPPGSPLDDEAAPASVVPESSGIVGLFGEGMVVMPESAEASVLASGAAAAVTLTSMTTVAANKERALRMMLTSEDARSIADCDVACTAGV